MLKKLLDWEIRAKHFENMLLDNGLVLLKALTCPQIRKSIRTFFFLKTL